MSLVLWLMMLPFHIVRIARSDSSFLFQSSTGTLVFALRHVKSIADGQRIIAYRVIMMNDLTHCARIHPAMHVSRAKQIIGVEEHQQLSLKERFIYRQVRAEIVAIHV